MNRAATWSRQPLAELTRSLTAVCMGREPADLVITGGRLVDVHTREVLDEVTSPSSTAGCAMFGDTRLAGGPRMKTIEAEGAYLVPGLVDTHLHLESVMVTAPGSRRRRCRTGRRRSSSTTNEMANAFGLDGTRWFLEEGQAARLMSRKPRVAVSA